MPTLYDKQGNPVEVPAEQVPQALASGKLGLPRGQKVVMRDETGEAYEYDPQDVVEASQSGFAVETPEQERQRKLQDEYGGTGGEMLAAGAGALRGLSFGASDAILAEAGLGEELSSLREANPTASTVGEIGAITGSLFAGGRGGTVRGLTAAPRGVARLGRGVEQAVGLGLKTAERSGVAKVLARGAEVGAGAAVEGAVYGAGQFVSDASLGDTEATAENLLQHVGMGAAIGGGFGAGIGGGFQGIGQLASGTAKLTKNGAESVVNMWERSTGNKALPGVADAFQETFNKASGAVTGRGDELAALSGREARADAVKSIEIRDTMARKYAELDNAVIEGTDAARDAATGMQKKITMRQIAKDGNGDLVKAEVDGLFGSGIPANVVDEAGNVIPNPVPGAGGMLAEVDDMVKMAKRGELPKAPSSDLQQVTDNAARKIREASGKADEVGRVQGIMDDYKREIGKIRERIERVRYPREKDFRMMERLEGMYERVRKPLEKEVLFGKAAAAAQSETNAAWVRKLANIRRRMDHRLRETWSATEWTKKTQSRPQGHRSLLDDMGTTKNDNDIAAILEQRSADRELMDVIEKHYELPPEALAKVNKARKALREMDALDKEAERVVGRQNQLRALEEATRNSGFDMSTGVVGGAILGGPVGAVAGGVLGAILNPAKTIRQLATLERIASGQRERIGAAISNLVSKAKQVGKRTGGARRLVAPIAVGASERHTFSANPKPSKGRVAAHQERVSELRDFVANQGATIRKLSEGSDVSSAVAPTVTQAVNATTVKAAQYLLDKAPKDPGRPGIFKKDWKPSLTDIARWERFAEAVCNPESVIKDLEQGTLTHEAVEALREIYPKTYQQIVEGLMDSADELAEVMPYQQRVQLSILFEAPVDDTMNPDFVASMQAGQIGAPQMQQQRPASPKVGHLEPMTQAQRLADDRRG